MTRSKFSIKAALLAGGIGLSMGGVAGSQPAAAQSYSAGYSCPAGYVYDATYGCTLPGETYDADGTYDPYASYDYGDYGYVPYGHSYSGGHRDFGHGFGHGMGGGVNHGAGFAHTGGGDFSHGMADGFNHGEGFSHATGGFGHGMGGGFHGGGGGHR